MFRVVKEWWEEKNGREKEELRDQLSRRGVESGRNHKEGVHDGGHGCGKPLGLPSSGKSSGNVGGQLLSEISGNLEGSIWWRLGRETVRRRKDAKRIWERSG